MTNFQIGVLQALRPANIITSLSNVCAGAAVSLLLLLDNTFEFPQVQFALLLLISALLYAGGIVLNDYFDAEIDKLERPDRPIPSGKITREFAAYFGFSLLITASLIATLVNQYSFYLSAIVSLCCLLYNTKAKNHLILGPIVMGLCRGFNFLLGASIISANIIPISPLWQIACLYVVYISAVTLISQEEVHAKHSYKLVLGSLLYLSVIFTMVNLLSNPPFRFFTASLFLIYFSYSLFKPLSKAFKNATPKNIGGCVKHGVLSVVIMDASLVAASQGILWGLMVLSLMFISQKVAKQFEMT